MPLFYQLIHLKKKILLSSQYFNNILAAHVPLNFKKSLFYKFPLTRQHIWQNLIEQKILYTLSL